MHYLDENCIGQAHKIPMNAVTMVMGFSVRITGLLIYIMAKEEQSGGTVD